MRALSPRDALLSVTARSTLHPTGPILGLHPLLSCAPVPGVQARQAHLTLCLSVLQLG